MEYEIPFFSIILPTYNRSEFILDAINSVVDQEFNDWELIIIDDGSTDDTRKKVNAIVNPRVQYCYKKNEERSIARNYGIDRAKGKYICFLDSDDKYLKNHLKVLHEKIKSENYPEAIFYTGMIQEGNGISRKTPFYDEHKYGHPFKFVWKEKLLINSVCVHKHLLHEHRFPVEFNIWEDTHLWLRLALKYPLHQVPVYTSWRKLHGESTVMHMFEQADFSKIKMYMNCVQDFYIKNKKEVNRHINQTEILNYKKNVIILCLRRVISESRFFDFLRFYILGIRHCNFKKFNQDVISIFRNYR